MTTTEPPLEIPGVGPAKLAILTDAGFTSLKRIARAKLDDIADLEGMAEKSALKLISYAQEKTGIGGPRSAMEALTELRNAQFISTNSKKVDDLLHGGIRMGNTWEIAGVNGAGKSQLAAQIAANTLLPKELGGIGGTACWVDTENTGKMAVGRIHQMLTAVGAPADKLLKENLVLVQCENSEMQVNVVRRFLDNDVRYDTLVEDGLMTKFRTEFRGRETLGERANSLAPHLEDLNNYAMRYDTAVVYTNQVMDSPEAYGGGPRAIGGNIAGHGAKYRLFIRKSQKGAIRIVRLDKSTDFPEGEAPCVLTEEGFTDTKKEIDE